MSKRDNLNEAIKDTKMTVKLKPDLAKGWLIKCLSDAKKQVRKAKAKKEKEAGDAAYKLKLFEIALMHYDNMWMHNDEDISILSKKAGVYHEMGRRDECIIVWDEAVKRGRDLVFKAWTSKGTCLMEMAECSKDYDPAIKIFEEALKKHHSLDIVKKRIEAKKSKEKLEQHDLGDYVCEKGMYNECFKQAECVEDINPKASQMSKRENFNEALEDAKKTGELKPNLAKGCNN